MTEPNDKLLDEYLRGESPVSRRYHELEAQDVPPQLDATVLAQAHAAVANRNKRKPTWVRWGAPLALAASAIMAVAIVLEVGVQDEVRMPAPKMEPRAERLTSAERAQDLRVIQDVNPDVPVDLQRSIQAPPSVANEQPAQARAAVAPKVERVSERKEISEPSAVSAFNAPSVPEPNAASGPSAVPAPNVPSESYAVSEPIAATTAAPEGVAQDAAAETRETGHEAVVITGSYVSGRSGGGGPRAAPQPSGTAPQPSQARRPAAFGPRASVAPTVPQQEAPRLSAEEWLERIRTLRRDGKVLEADEQWREFRETYPNYAVNETDLAQPKPSP